MTRGAENYVSVCKNKWLHVAFTVTYTWHIKDMNLLPNEMAVGCIICLPEDTKIIIISSYVLTVLTVLCGRFSRFCQAKNPLFTMTV